MREPRYDVTGLGATAERCAALREAGCLVLARSGGVGKGHEVGGDGMVG